MCLLCKLLDVAYITDVSDNGLLSMFLVTILIWESTKAKPLWAESTHNGPAIVSTLGEISWQM